MLAKATKAPNTPPGDESSRSDSSFLPSKRLSVSSVFLSRKLTLKRSTAPDYRVAGKNDQQAGFCSSSCLALPDEPLEPPCSNCCPCRYGWSIALWPPDRRRGKRFGAPAQTGIHSLGKSGNARKIRDKAPPRTRALACSISGARKRSSAIVFSNET